MERRGDSGDEDNRGLHGVGFFVNSKARKAVLEFEPVNMRLSKIRIKGRFNKITIISAYAPPRITQKKTKLNSTIN